MLKICLSGVDGSGKTTQATILKIYFSKIKNLKIYYLWLRWFSFTTYLLYIYSKLTHKTITVRTDTGFVHIHIFWTDKALQKLYPKFMLFDLTLRYIINIIIASINKVDVIILDRSFLDAITDLVWETRSVRFFNNIIIKIILKIIASYKCIVLIADYKTTIKRKSDIISLNEIKFKRRLFEIFARYLNIPIIDTTNKSVLVTWREIREALKLEAD